MKDVIIAMLIGVATALFLELIGLDITQLLWWVSMLLINTGLTILWKLSD